MDWNPLDDIDDFSSIPLAPNTNAQIERQLDVHKETKPSSSQHQDFQSKPQIPSDGKKSGRNNRKSKVWQSGTVPTQNNDDDNDLDGVSICSTLNSVAIPSGSNVKFDQNRYTTIQTNEKFIKERNIPFLIDNDYFKLTSQTEESTEADTDSSIDPNVDLEKQFSTLFSNVEDEEDLSSAQDEADEYYSEVNKEYYRNITRSSNAVPFAEPSRSDDPMQLTRVLHVKLD